MRNLTIEGHLKRQIVDLSGENTHSVSKLIRTIDSNSILIKLNQYGNI